jgi:hypothetical protein
MSWCEDTEHASHPHQAHFRIDGNLRELSAECHEAVRGVERWRSPTALSLERGMQAGTVRPNISPRIVAALIVAAQMGIWGSGKSSRSGDVMCQATDGVCDYLESLRP